MLKKIRFEVPDVLYITLILAGVAACISTPIKLVEGGETGIYAWIGSLLAAIGFTVGISYHYYLTVLRWRR